MKYWLRAWQPLVCAVAAPIVEMRGRRLQASGGHEAGLKGNFVYASQTNPCKLALSLTYYLGLSRENQDDQMTLIGYNLFGSLNNTIYLGACNQTSKNQVIASQTKDQRPKT